MASLIFMVGFVFLGFFLFFPTLVLGFVGEGGRVSVLTGIFGGGRLFVVDLPSGSLSRSWVGVISAVVRVLAHEISHATTISTWFLV